MKLRLPKKAREALVVTLVLFILGSSFLTARAVNPGETEKSVPQYSYSHKANVAYRAYLLPNSLYSDKSLGPGMVYVTPFVDYINTYFTYEFKGERQAAYKGDYEVRAVIEASEDKSKKVIWQREYPLVTKTPFSGNDAVARIDREIPLRVNEYNLFVKKVTDEAKFIPEVLRLVVKWTINIEAQTEYGVIKKQLTPTMIVPLGGRYFEVTGDHTKSETGAIEKPITVTAEVNRNSATLSGALLVVSVLLLTFVILFTMEQRDIDPEQLKLKQILKTHADRLVAIGKEIGATPDQIMPVKSMDDLIRIADELGRPIIYEGKGTASAAFYVMDDNKVFTYEFGSTGAVSASSPIHGSAPSRVLRRGVSRSNRPSAGV